MPNYDSRSFTPPAPLALVLLRNPESGAVQRDVPMLLDTGADVSLLPHVSLSGLGVTPAEDERFELTGFDGTVSLAPLVRVELIFLGQLLRGEFPLIAQDYGILGRNILNALPLLFDGPNQTWDLVQP
ncbi:MAG: aspartyl protease family protein [Pyrinomonadaceae bacterium]